MDCSEYRDDLLSSTGIMNRMFLTLYYMSMHTMLEAVCGMKKTLHIPEQKSGKVLLLGMVLDMKYIVLLFILLNISTASAQEYAHDIGCSTDQHNLLLMASYVGPSYVGVWGGDLADVIPLTYVRSTSSYTLYKHASASDEWYHMVLVWGNVVYFYSNVGSYGIFFWNCTELQQ